MFVTVHHQIRDPKLWEESTKRVMADMEDGRLPSGLKGLMYLPSADGRQAVCLWEANKLEDVKTYLELTTGKAAKNEYSQVNQRAAVGLPAQEEAGPVKEEPVEEAMHLAV
jgi:hypothetical protein